MQRRAPNCEIDTSVYEDPVGGRWRYVALADYVNTYVDTYHDRYIKLRQQFGDYDYTVYNFTWNDPLFDEAYRYIPQATPSPSPSPTAAPAFGAAATPTPVPAATPAPVYQEQPQVYQPYYEPAYDPYAEYYEEPVYEPEPEPDPVQWTPVEQPNVDLVFNNSPVSVTEPQPDLSVQEPDLSSTGGQASPELPVMGLDPSQYQGEVYIP